MHEASHYYLYNVVQLVQQASSECPLSACDPNPQGGRGNTKADMLLEAMLRDPQPQTGLEMKYRKVSFQEDLLGGSFLRILKTIQITGSLFTRVSLLMKEAPPSHSAPCLSGTRSGFAVRCLDSGRPWAHMVLCSKTLLILGTLLHTRTTGCDGPGHPTF